MFFTAHKLIGCAVTTRSDLVTQTNKDSLCTNPIKMSKRFQCPSECRCILGNRNVTSVCPGGTSSTHVLYPPDVELLSRSDTGIHGIDEDAFQDISELTEMTVLVLSSKDIA